MDATDFQNDKEEQRPSGGMHPLAAAVALAVAGALAGCASQSLPLDAPEVDRAKAAFARRDYTEAARLLSEPAMKGDAGAQYALGYLYYYGQGVPQDFYRARTWLETSAQLGNRDAKRALAALKVYGKLPSAVGTRAPSTAQAAQPAPAPARAAAQPSDPVKEESAAAVPAMAPASATPVGAAPEKAAAAPAPVVTPAPEAKELPPAPAPVAGSAPVAPTPDAPVVVAPTPASAPEERAPVASVPVVPAAPVRAAPAAEPARPAPVAPKENPAAAESETAGAAVVIDPAPELQARSPEPAVEVAPRAAPVPAPVEPNPEVLPGETGLAVRESGAEPVARPVALERPAPAAVTLVPGSERAQPVRKPVPRSERPRYTIHLLSSPSKEELMQTVRSFGLAQAAWYPVQQGNGTHYRLIFGGYDTMVEAREALRALPEALYARNPWVNNYPESVTVTAFNGIPTARVAAVGRDVLR